MTRKDFELIARSLATAYHHSPSGMRVGITHAAEALAVSLKTTNPRFDAATFLNACHKDPT